MSHHRHGRILLAAMFILCAASARGADATWPVPRGPSHEPVPYRYDAAAWKAVPHDFLDDAASCTLYAATTYLIEADGTVETICHDITRLNGRKGVEKLGEYRNIIYSPSYQTLTLNKALIHKADGGTVDVQPRHVQLRDVTTDYQVYDHEKQLIISFPTLEVGDVIEVKWTVRGKNPEYQGHFFTRYTFGDDTYPVVRDELRIRVPKGKELKYAAIGGKIEPKISADDKTCALISGRSAIAGSYRRTTICRRRKSCVSGVGASTFASWDEVARWKQTLRADCWQCTEEVRKVVQDATRDCKTQEEKARALAYWLRRNIRYVSSGEKHDYTPHPPATIFANRYGDCKDTSQLLAAMFKEAGIPVELATLGALDDGQMLEAVPSPWGTHAILLATIDGRPHWIDTTLEPRRLGLPPARRPRPPLLRRR